MAVPGIVTPYSPNSTDASWKAAKTASIRDKWNTELGASLRAAQLAYGKIKWDVLDVGRITQAHGQFRIAADIDVAKTAAQAHYNVAVKPAIKALETAKSNARTAGLNPIISKPSSTKAKAIALDLTTRITQLKGINFTDFDTETARVLRLLQFTYQGFVPKMNTVLHAADQFVAAVRATPTPATFNDGVQDAARGITQMIGQVEKLYKNDMDLGKDHARATALFNTLNPWANHQVTVLATANRTKVLAKIIEFNGHVTAVKAWWR